MKSNIFKLNFILLVLFGFLNFFLIWFIYYYEDKRETYDAKLSFGKQYKYKIFKKWIKKICGYKIDNGYAEDGYFQSRNAEFEP